MKIKAVNHIAVICSDYETSMKFYQQILGFELLSEEYREARNSWMAKLALNGTYILELFTFPNSPKRQSYPEAQGLRHLALTVDNLEKAAKELEERGILHEPIRHNLNGESCFFFSDPDGLPIEIVEGT